MRTWLRAFFAVLAAGLLLSAQEPRRFVHFGTPYGAASRPSGPLTPGPDGMLFGISTEGGEFGGGTIFRVVEDGSAYEVVHSFRWEEGTRPHGPLLATTDGWLCGTAFEGGDHGVGTAYRIRADGSEFGVLHHFRPESWDVNSPSGSLVRGPDNTLFGVSGSGGGVGLGGVFRMNPDGSDYRLIWEFPSGHPVGYYPRDQLLFSPDGWLVGMTGYDSTEGKGTLFRLRPDGSDITVSARFGGIPGWSGSVGNSLVALADGTFLGVTSEYVPGAGTFLGKVFRFHPGGAGHRILRHLNGNTGSFPVGPPIVGFDGWVYLATTTGSTAGSGTVIRFSPDDPDTNAVEVVHRFANGGLQPQGLVQDPAGWIWGVTANGRSSLEAGTLFRFRPTAPGIPVTVETLLAPNFEPNVVVLAPATREDRTNLVVTFRRLSNVDSPASLVARTVGSTARPGFDFKPVDAVVRFPAGVAEQTLLIPLIDDSLGFGERSLQLRFSDLVGPVLPAPSVELRIQDNDPYSFFRTEFLTPDPFQDWPPAVQFEGSPDIRLRFQREFPLNGTNRVRVRYEVRAATRDEVASISDWESYRPAVAGVNFQPQAGTFEFTSTAAAFEVAVPVPQNFVATGPTAVTVLVEAEDPRFGIVSTRTLLLGDDEISLLPIESPAEGLGLAPGDLHFLLEDGRLMVLPTVSTGVPAQFVVLGTNGLPDSLWGDGGRLTAPVPPAGHVAEAPFVGPDGSLFFPQRRLSNGHLQLARCDRHGRPQSTVVSSLRFKSLLAVFPDGDCLVDSEASGLVRLRADGTVDPTFVPPGGLVVQSAAVDARGRIYLTRTNASDPLIRLREDGSLDTLYRPLSDRRGRRIESLLVAPDGSAAVLLDSDESIRLEPEQGGSGVTVSGSATRNDGQTSKGVFGVGASSDEVLSASPLSGGRMAVVRSVGCWTIQVQIVEADGRTWKLGIPTLDSFTQWRSSQMRIPSFQVPSSDGAKNGWGGGGGWSFECDGGATAIVGPAGVWIHDATTLSYTPFAEPTGRVQFVESLAVRVESQAQVTLARLGSTADPLSGRVQVSSSDPGGHPGAAVAEIPVRFEQGMATAVVETGIPAIPGWNEPRWFRLRFLPDGAPNAVESVGSDLLVLDLERRNGSLQLARLPRHLGDGVLTALHGKESTYLVQQGPDFGFDSEEVTRSFWIDVGIEDRVRYRLHRPPDGEALFFRGFSE